MIKPLIIGIVAEGALVIWALKWTLSKSNVAFFSVFFGDALLRLLVLGVATWWLGAHHLPYVGPLLTLGLGFLAMSILQIPFLYKAR